MSLDDPPCPRCGAPLPVDAATQACSACATASVVAIRVDPGPVKPGTVLKRRFDILGELGRGGQGVVYRVRPKGGSGEFALKFVDSKVDEGHLLETEELSSTLHHPNIVDLLAVGTDQDEAGQRRRFVVYEIVEGVTLGKLLADGGLPIARAVELAFQVLAGLAHAHARGIAHLDVKPENVLLTRGGQAKIADFGLGRWVGEADQAPRVQTGLFGGTPTYCAPEQIRGEPRRASDVYAFGMMFHEMLTGSAPFAHQSVQRALANQLGAQPEPPSRARPEVSPELDRFVAACLVKAPERRFEDGATALAALRRVAAGLKLPVPLAPVMDPPRALALTSTRGLAAAGPRLALAALWLGAPVVRAALGGGSRWAGALWLALGAALTAWIGRRLEENALAGFRFGLFEPGVAPHVEKAAAACAFALAVGLPAPPAVGPPPLLPFAAVFQALAGWLLFGAPLTRWVEAALEDPDQRSGVVALEIVGPASLSVKSKPLPLRMVLKPGTHRITVTHGGAAQELVLPLPEPGRALLALAVVDGRLEQVAVRPADGSAPAALAALPVCALVGAALVSALVRMLG